MIQIVFSQCTTKLAYGKWLRYNAISYLVRAPLARQAGSGRRLGYVCNLKGFVNNVVFNCIHHCYIYIRLHGANEWMIMSFVTVLYIAACHFLPILSLDRHASLLPQFNAHVLVLLQLQSHHVKI